MSARRSMAAAEAAEWFARRQGGPMTSQDEAVFEVWLARDPEHAAAFADIMALWSGLEPYRAEPRVLRLREEARAAARRSSTGRLVKRALAACLAVSILTLGVVALERMRPVGWTPEPTTFATRVGQTTSISLPDGTLAILDTNSELRAWPMGQTRRVELVRGRAFFKVAKDSARPFIVQAGNHTVTALGTEFDVDLRPSAFSVTLAEGRVRVGGAKTSTAPPMSVEMNAGFQLIDRQGDWSVRRADTRNDVGWISGRLVFDDAPLSVIAAELSRYSTQPVLVAPEIASVRMSAVLPATDPSAFIASAEALGLGRGAGAAESYRLEAR